jgi:hypothetical protein
LERQKRLSGSGVKILSKGVVVFNGGEVVGDNRLFEREFAVVKVRY